jgi:hypothetical protein
MTTAYGNTQMMPAVPAPSILPSVAAPDISGYGALTGIPRSQLGLPEAPGMGGGAGGGFFGDMNGMQKVGAGLQLAQGLMGLYSGLKMMKLAKKDFNMRRDMANINLNNTIKSYNTALSDRARSRGFTEGQSQGQIDSYVSSNSMTRDASRRNVGG